MPDILRQKLYHAWRGSGAFNDAAQRYDAVNLGPDIEAFIASYYAPDYALLAEARETLAGSAR